MERDIHRKGHLCLTSAGKTIVIFVKDDLMMHDLLSYISNHNNIGVIVRIVCASYVVMCWGQNAL